MGNILRVGRNSVERSTSVQRDINHVPRLHDAQTTPTTPTTHEDMRVNLLPRSWNRMLIRPTGGSGLS